MVVWWPSSLSLWQALILPPTGRRTPMSRTIRTSESNAVAQAAATSALSIYLGSGHARTQSWMRDTHPFGELSSDDVERRVVVYFWPEGSKANAYIAIVVVNKVPTQKGRRKFEWVATAGTVSPLKSGTDVCLFEVVGIYHDEIKFGRTT